MSFEETRLKLSERPRVSREELVVLLKAADIPVLLMVLVHLTGDKRWIEAPYLPARDLAFFPDESGGLSDSIQGEIRSAACEALVAYYDGALDVSPEPSDQVFARMMSVCVGEPFPPEYLTMVLEEMGFRDRDPPWSHKPSSAAVEGFKVLVIGAGMSGLCAAIKLRKANIPFTVVEKNPRVGGTWYENRYPGVGCDVPNHFYSYSFRPNMDWTEYFSSGEEIEEYFQTCSREYDILDRIQFRTEAIKAEFDRDTSLWRVTLRGDNGDIITEFANIVVFAAGQLNRPKYPDIEGLRSFAGLCFHTARWPENLSLRGKRVVVVGTGASAMQLAPTVANQAERITIFQRSAQWTIPTRDYHRIVSEEKKWLLNHVPFYGGWYRFSLIWRYSDRLLASVRRDPAWPHPQRSLNARNDRHRQILTDYIQEELSERTDLLDKALPKYPPYGKRILVDNGWFRTLKRDNVEIITDSISRITIDSVVTRTGAEYPADVIVFATGFQAAQALGAVEVGVKGGRSLNDVWGDDNPKAYLGMTVPGFPNLFFLYGPNTNLGHGGSIIFVAECQVRYVLAFVKRMLEEKIREIECRQDAHDEYNKRVDEEHSNLIWTHPGMNSWYRNKAGRIFSVMPWRLVDYWQFTREPNFDDFKIGK